VVIQLRLHWTVSVDFVIQTWGIISWWTWSWSCIGLWCYSMLFQKFLDLVNSFLTSKSNQLFLFPSCIPSTNSWILIHSKLSVTANRHTNCSIIIVIIVSLCVVCEFESKHFSPSVTIAIKMTTLATWFHQQLVNSFLTSFHCFAKSS